MKIRIIAVPTGEAPERARKDLVGCEFSVADISKLKNFLHTPARFGEPPNPEEVYLVEMSEVVVELKKKFSLYVSWWEDHVDPDLTPYCFMPYMVFKKDTCKVI